MVLPDSINYFSIALGLGGVIAIVSSSVVYASDTHKPENVHWFLSNVFAAIWSFGYLFMITANNVDVAYGSNLILHSAAIFIPLFYLSFVVHLTDTNAKYRRSVQLFSIASIILLFANFSHNFVRAVIPKFVFNFAPYAGPWYGFFTFYFFAIVIYALFVLARARHDQKTNKLFKYIFYVSLLGFAGGGSVFFLTFNVNFPPYPIILFSLYPIVISYAILRHHIFNAKVIATELFIFALWGFIIGRIILADTLSDQMIEVALLAATIIVGVILIRNVIKEVQTRERMESLANELATANERLTQLDQQKSEFLSIASHQLRSPLTAIKGYSSMILEGSFGKVTEPKLREAIDRIFLSSERLVIIIEDFLNVSRIEQGRMQYDFSTVNLEELVDGVVKELEQNSKKAELAVTFEKGANGPFFIHADFGKVRQMVTNLLDNAIKYTKKGSVTLSIDKDVATRKILVKIKDTGIGIAPEVIPMLFQKFTRDKNAGKVDIMGTGLGLYVVKELMKAHKGNVWVESPGEGKGSTFYLEFMAE